MMSYSKIATMSDQTLIQNIDNIVSILYDSKSFWKILNSYETFGILQSVSKSFVVNDKHKLDFLYNICFQIKITNVEYMRNLFDLRKFKCKYKSCFANTIFKAIQKKYNNSWNNVKLMLEPKMKKRESLNKALYCYYDLTLTNLYKDQSMKKCFVKLMDNLINNSSKEKIELHGFKIMCMYFYVYHTNFDKIFKYLYSKYSKYPRFSFDVLHEDLFKYFLKLNFQVNIPDDLPWFNKKTKQYHEYNLDIKEEFGYLKFKFLGMENVRYPGCNEVLNIEDKFNNKII